MQTIHVLPEHIVSQIAAGEVIERPAYIIKELVENSIDAQAKTITVSIVDGGVSEIHVLDDGCGMSPEDLKLCFTMHSTSKLSDEEDLHAITSCGFRGEALASIAAISTIEIQSRQTSDPIGMHIQIKEGNVVKSRPIGMAVGTQVHVSDVFAHVPARLQMITNHKTELRHCTELMVQLSLAHPTIHFRFLHNKKVVFDLPNQSQAARIEQVLTSTFIQSSLPLRFSDSYVQIDGFISTPQDALGTAQKQYFIVNNRFVKDKMLSLALKESFGTLIEARSYPQGVIYLTLPPELVDVNVHPKKEEVRFLHAKIVFDALVQAVKDTLQSHNITYTSKGILPNREKLTDSYAGRLLKRSVITQKVSPTITVEKIIQVHDVYIVAQTELGMLIVDQHAAHERIMYEKFLAHYLQERGKRELYRLKPPIHLFLSFAEISIVRDQQDLLRRIGFTVRCTKDGITIRTVPLLLKDRNIEQLFKEILMDLTTNNSDGVLDNGTKKMIAYLACRSAIKAGDTVSPEFAKKLLDELFVTANYATCPHGRPTIVQIPLLQLHKEFKRV